MHSLHYIDYLIIFVYFVAIMMVGLVMTRKASANIDEYFLAGRSMPWYLLGIAGMTMWFDMTGTMIITSFLYMLGPRGLFIEFRGGAVLVLAFLLCYAGKWHRRSGCMTGGEWMTYRFGEGRPAELIRLLTAVMGIVAALGMLAYLVRGMSLFIDMFLPWPPVACALVVVGLTTLYTMCAGFYGVVLTDVIQGIIILIACVLVGLIAWHLVPDANDLARVAHQVTGNEQWISSVPSWHTTMPRGYEAYESLMMFMLFYLLRNVLGGMGSGAEPRFFAARNDRECGLQSLLQGFAVMMRWPMMIGFAVIGIYMVHAMYPDMSKVDRASQVIHQYYPETKENVWHDLTTQITGSPEKQSPELVASLQATLGERWQERMPLIGYNGTINPERILPAVLKTQVPVGLKGVILVALFAAMMSTFTCTVNGASAFFVKDIYQKFLRPAARNRELIAISYASTLGIVVLGSYLGLAARNINELWGWIVMSLGAGALAPAILRLYWWRCNAWGMSLGTLLGGVGSIVQRAVDPGMVEWQQFIWMTLLSFVGTIGGSLLTSPTSMERLRHFYRTTRPFGLWGPVREAFSPQERVEMSREHKNDIISVPFALLAQVSLFLLPMQLIIKQYGAFMKTLPIFLVGAIGLYFFWWRNLPPAVPQEAASEEPEASLAETELQLQEL